MNSFDRPMNVPAIAIVILNWNGWGDTCECLASLLESSYQNFQVILIDNGSADDSIEKIKLWANGGTPISIGPHSSNSRTYIVPYKEHSLSDADSWMNKTYPIDRCKMILISSPENLGFAKGCNVGIRYAIQSKFKYIFLVNNDTTIESICLEKLVDFMDNHSSVAVSSPLIMYYKQPEIIWSYGGELTFTWRKYNYLMNKRIGSTNIPEIKKVSFISGCALFARTNAFSQFGLLSDKFFFGEEDYEFSIRLKRHQVKQVAISSAKAYHKFGESKTKIFADDWLAYAFTCYLNRFINRKLNYKGPICWQIWRLICLSYIVPKLIIVHRYPLPRVGQFIRLLWKYSNCYDCVDRDIFFKAKELIK